MNHVLALGLFDFQDKAQKSDGETVIPTPPEVSLLKYFAKIPGARLIESIGRTEGSTYVLMQAVLDKYVGVGRAKTRLLATVKAVAECLERKFCQESFVRYPGIFKPFNRNSNGFAVHFSRDQAKQASLREALERHILQYAFLKDGWQGFWLFEKKQDVFDISKIIARYTCSGHAAGMVVARSKNFAGVSLGYLCTPTDEIQASTRWTHATQEAFDKIDPMLTLIREGGSDWLSEPIANEAHYWISHCHQISFGKNHTKEIPRPNLVTSAIDLSAAWGLDFPFFGAFTFGDNLLPLLIPGRIGPEQSSNVKDILRRVGLSPNIPKRNPIL